MEKITNWWKAWRAARKESFRERVRKHKEIEAKRDIQPLVWNGRVWLAYCGIPIVEAGALKQDLLKSVEESQKTLAEFNIEMRY